MVNTERLFSIKIPEFVPEGAIGRFEVHHFDISEKESELSKFEGRYYNTLEYGCSKPGRYAKLMIRSALSMCDIQSWRATRSRFVQQARGNVLVAGLGLGLVLFAIANDPEVKHITVVEKHQEVVDLVGPYVQAQFGDRLTIVVADIFEWLPEKDAKYDTIYFDIWSDFGPSQDMEIKLLNRKFRRHKTKDGWKGSCCSRYHRYHKYQ